MPYRKPRGGNVRYTQLRKVLGATAIFTAGTVAPGWTETRGVTNGLEVHETALILQAEMPTHLVTKESCATAETGWKIVPESAKADVVTARMMDPSGDPDWKVEKAEARTRIDRDNTRICLWGYCQGPLQFECEIEVRASWQESR